MGIAPPSLWLGGDCVITISIVETLIPRLYGALHSVVLVITVNPGLLQMSLICVYVVLGLCVVTIYAVRCVRYSCVENFKFCPCECVYIHLLVS